MLHGEGNGSYGEGDLGGFDVIAARYLDRGDLDGYEAYMQKKAGVGTPDQTTQLEPGLDLSVVGGDGLTLGEALNNAEAFGARLAEGEATYDALVAEQESRQQ